MRVEVFKVYHKPERKEMFYLAVDGEPCHIDGLFYHDTFELLMSRVKHGIITIVQYPNFESESDRLEVFNSLKEMQDKYPEYYV